MNHEQDSPHGSTPEGSSVPETSGTDRPVDDQPESLGKLLGQKVLEGAATALGSTLMSAMIFTGGMAAYEMLNGPHHDGGAAFSNICTV
ncbi:hypothetical protein ACFCWB_27515 [Streptomyces bacillaris]|uniref:hypothetical protein n=1 Tax=Streptomyces bacillaris TaxID=68179 RepID=UPI0035D6A9FC